MATKFDAVEARKRQKEAAKKKERKDGVGRIYPVVGITNSGYIKLAHNGLLFYADVFKPKALTCLNCPFKTLIRSRVSFGGYINNTLVRSRNCT